MPPISVRCIVCDQSLRAGERLVCAQHREAFLRALRRRRAMLEREREAIQRRVLAKLRSSAFKPS